MSGKVGLWGMDFALSVGNGKGRERGGGEGVGRKQRDFVRRTDYEIGILNYGN